MIYRDDSKIIVDGIKRDINVSELQKLAYTYLPDHFSLLDKERFVDEVIFRIADLEFENINTHGKSIEEYYFAACLAYAEENGFNYLYSEEDDGKIFECCGSELELE